MANCQIPGHQQITNVSVFTVGIFTVSRAGVYHFSFGMQQGPSGNYYEMVVKKQGTNNEVRTCILVLHSLRQKLLIQNDWRVNQLGNKVDNRQNLKLSTGHHSYQRNFL